MKTDNDVLSAKSRIMVKGGSRSRTLLVFG